MRATLVLSICVSILTVGPAWGATWYVDDSTSSSGDGKSPETAFKSIQEGIDASSEGDTVIVEEGIYVENIQFRGKNIVLRSTDPFDPAVIANTILDGSQSGSVVTFLGTETKACILSGLVIWNGEASYGGGILGGSESQSCQATIENNTITGNSATVGGGISYCNGTIQNNTITGNWTGEEAGGLYWCDGTIQNNTITGNSAGLYGGALSACSAMIQNNTIAENSSDWLGGGLAFCNRTIRKNTITDNFAGSYGGGLAVCDGTVQNNTIAGNSAGEEGGGLYWCDGTIVNNAITGNSAGAEGGGLHWCCGPCGGKIQNNSIVGNSAGWYGGGLADCEAATLNCIIWGNTAPTGPQLYESSIPTYSCIEGWTGDSKKRNISGDPCFAGPDTRHFRLLPSSPCIDAGYNDLGLPPTDIAGTHRIMYGGKSLTVDMGPYEFYINDLARGPNPEQTTFTWSSLADKTYSIFYTDDLVTWHLAIDSFPSSGSLTTSWVDDGSLTGFPPSLVPRRFYRILENP